MRVSSRLFRISLWLATTSLTVSATLPAIAQPAPPAGADQASGEGGDPPAIAGRLARVTGGVSFHASGEDHWNTASVNYPVTTGEAFWTEAQAQAEIQIADDRMVLAGSTELDVAQLDQQNFVVTEPQGALFVQLNSLANGQSLTVNTPRGAVQITGAGRYEIVAGDTNDATTVTVVDGAARVTATGLSLDVGAQQTATIGGTDSFQGSVAAMQQDDFLASQLREQAPQATSAPPQVRQQVQYMTGGSELAQYGSWNQNAQYGQVWYPRDVASDWAPYRDGHWAYVQPWGWTWVDNARWGFAPFHYGRWVQVDDRWGWIAGAPDAPVDDYPVYSPAMVSFVDVGGAALAGAAIGFGIGVLAASWIPLGPREPFYPWYRTRGDYFARINGRYGVPRDIIQRGPTYINNVHQTNIYINQRGATVMPAAGFARGEGVRGAGRPLPAAALAEARPVRGRLPVTPTAATPNLTRAAAQPYNVALPAQPARVAPGPRIAPEAARTGARAAAPALRQTPPPANVRAVPAAQVRPGPGVGAGARRPGLRAAGAPGPRIGAREGRAALRAPGAGRPVEPQIGAPHGGEARPGAGAPRPEAGSQIRPTPTPRPGERAVTPREPSPALQPRTPVEPRAPRPAEPRPAPVERPAAPERAVPRPAPAIRAPERPAIQPRPVQPRPVEPRPVEPRPSEPRPQIRPQMERPAPAFHAPAPAFHAPPPRPAAPAPHPAAPAPEERRKPG